MTDIDLLRPGTPERSLLLCRATEAAISARLSTYATPVEAIVLRSAHVGIRQAIASIRQVIARQQSDGQR